jgi:hypothetical protein
LCAYSGVLCIRRRVYKSTAYGTNRRLLASGRPLHERCSAR